MSKKTIVGFGYEAGSGKDECASHAAKLYAGSKPFVTSFARRLRKEIHGEMYQKMADHYLSPREALELMCKEAGVPFDPFAARDSNNPHGKQRALQQWYGTEYRRASNPNYWVEAAAEDIEKSGSNLILISDVRFINEAGWIRSQGGVVVHVNRLHKQSLDADSARHSSEQELSGYDFDHVIENDGTLKELHAKVRDLFLKILQPSLF